MGIREYIDDAIRTGKTVTIKYIKYGGEYSIRQISDIQYSDEFGDDYIQAFCHMRHEDRTFKISRIISVDGITDTPLSSLPGVKKPKTAYTGNTAASGSTLSSKPSSYNSDSLYKPSLSNRTNFNKPTYSSSYKPSSSTKKSEGCYIATMAYGDYNHPQVIVLRRYRDDVLLKTIPGQLFVKSYYWFSPKLVRILTGHKHINAFIRRCLDKIIERIKV